MDIQNLSKPINKNMVGFQVMVAKPGDIEGMYYESITGKNIFIQIMDIPETFCHYFRKHPAGYSGIILPPIPETSCHLS